MTPAAPDDVAQALARAHARLGAFAGRVDWRDEVGSTNDVVLALAGAGAEEGRVVAAGVQINGRGRRGRAWASPAGAGVYASALLRPSMGALPLLTLAAGIALAEGIGLAAGLHAVVKWPNDLVVERSGRRLKLAGVLAEAGSVPNEPPHVVLGFGINVGYAVYPEDVAARATSIESELGRQVDRGLVLAECLAAVWRRYRDLEEGRAAAVLEAWRQRAGGTFGRRVEWDSLTGVRSGVAVAVDESGALLVRSGSGEQRVISGEVRWL
jgi:BirA family transcriptional regulator, biotin operon repressor / biotin---[acetyl-CoA-carboxylase] ligase